MLIEEKQLVGTVKVNPTFRPAENSYPHYRMIPMQTEAGKYHCLLFYVSTNDFLILEPKIKRHLAVKKMVEHLKTATFTIYEIEKC